jgi:hypothetical protein
VLCGVCALTGRHSLPVACPTRSSSTFASRSGDAHSPQSCPLAADPAAPPALAPPYGGRVSTEDGLKRVGGYRPA